MKRAYKRTDYEQGKRREARMQALRQRRDGLRALMHMHEKARNHAEARRLGAIVRLTRQQLRYMGDDEECEASEVENNLIGKHL